MGCDEHFYLEVKDRTSGRWQLASGTEPNPYYEEEKEEWDATPEDARNQRFAPRERRPVQFELTGGRNYDAYAILADVRNGGLDPIDEPRGLPGDVCAEVEDESWRWGGDGHSHTWISVRDVLAYDWAQVVQQKLTIPLKPYYHWCGYGRRENREPSFPSEAHRWHPRWLPGWDGDRPPLTMAEADTLIETVKRDDPNAFLSWARKPLYLPQDTPREEIAAIIPPPFAGVLVEAEWTQLYSEVAGELWTRGVPTMIQTMRQHKVGVDDVRAVGWFDN